MLVAYDHMMSSAMAWRSRSIKFFLDKWPGKKTLGLYRFLPVFFCMGAVLEYSMINWHAGEVNFYKTFKKRRAHELAVEKLGIS